MVLVVHVASQAYLTEVLCGSPETVCAADLASSKLVVRIISCSNCWLCHQRFAHSSKPLSCYQYQSPEAKSARYSLFWGLVDRRFLVLSVLEARGLAFVRVVEDMAEARVRSPVCAVSPSFVLQLLLRRHGSVHFANTLHLPISIEYVAVCVINPSGIAASIVLRSTDVQCFWRMSIVIQVLVVIESFRPNVRGEPGGRRARQWHATIGMSHGSPFIGSFHFFTQHVSGFWSWHHVDIGKA